MIGVLAYGSLISNPGDELARITVSEKRDVLTPFPVEFARSSAKRCGAPTLVPVRNGGRPVRAVIFEVNVDEGEAIDIVYRREIDEVGSGKKYVERPAHWKNAVGFDRFEHYEGFEVVISTRMPANIPSPSAEILAQLAIASAEKLGDGRDGISYLMDAKACGIETQLSSGYEHVILYCTQTSDLGAALETIRSRAI